jgi:hypothetical protein
MAVRLSQDGNATGRLESVREGFYRALRKSSIKSWRTRLQTHLGINHESTMSLKQRTIRDKNHLQSCGLKTLDTFELTSVLTYSEGKQ